MRIGGKRGDFVIGIDLGASHLHYASADLAGEILGESSEPIQPEAGPRKMITQIIQGIRRIAGEGMRRRGRGSRAESVAAGGPRAIALGVPGAVDVKRGVVTLANNLPGWTDVPLKRELEKAFRAPLVLENDANMAALGESWLGVARGFRNFVFIALGTGIGSGVFLDGQLYRGRTGSAGEIHRMNLEWQRWQEDFGDIGYFESYVSGLGIAAEGGRRLGRATGAEVSGLREQRDAGFVFESFRKGNREARRVLENVFTMLGVGIANVVAVLDPDLIVFGGGVTKGASELLLSTVQKVVRRLHPHPPGLKVSALGDKAQIYGALYAARSAAVSACPSPRGRGKG